jgi:A118 family predicted phage portal protein
MNIEQYTTFPPENEKESYELYKEWSSWYSGKADNLIHYYQKTKGSNGRFWRAQDLNKNRTRVHVPLASDIAAFSANMLFSEGLKTEYAEDEKTDKRLEEIKQLSNVRSKLSEAGETAAALGGVFLKPTWDKSLADHPILTIAQPDNTFAVFRYGYLVGVGHHRDLERTTGGTVWRHIEIHEKGKIFNFLFKGNDSNFGTKKSLKDHPETTGLEDEVNTGIPFILPEYVPNKLPNRIIRGSNYGLSDFAGVESLLDSLDSTMSSWIRDIEIGRGKIIVPEHYLEYQDGNPSFDMQEEIFFGLKGLGETEKDNTITPNQFAIRMEEHKQTVYELASTIVNMAGYSPQSFGFSLQGGISTQSHEVRERKTIATKQNKEGYFKSPIQRTLQKMLMIDNIHFGSGVKYEAMPSVEFSDTLNQDFHQTAATVELLNRAQAISTDTKVRLLHPDWNEEQIKEEVSAITKQNSFENPLSVGGKEIDSDLDDE